MISKGLGPSSVQTRLSDLQRFTRRHPDILMATTLDLTTYLAGGIESRGWGAEYVKKIRSSLRSFYQWTTIQGLTPVDPAYGLPRVRVPRALPHPTPEDVVRAAMARAPESVRAMILLAATEGLRRSEIAALHPDDRRGDAILVRGKGGRQRLVPLDSLTGTVLDNLERLQGLREHYFPGRFGGHLHPCTIYKKVTEYTPGFTLHSLRHRAATIGYASTRDLRATQEFLGHQSPATTQIYTAIDTDALRNIVNANSLGVCQINGGSDLAHC
ncbi:tyrosine-type recombinase/integrase [Humibacter albus]|uniref:tyrosine-type recombinase/integrase n=1 Tax=Humibacter albus TaxID=427754 RepID=UPI00146A936B|nr:tyrosine-type recombinase/integrase [Humibacter albus]